MQVIQPAEEQIAEKPFWLRGNFAPVTEEVSEANLRVKGSIPDQLSGFFLRNGPNPKSGTSAHWFFGDGMVHGVALRDGKALWYRNRWVRTRLFTDGAEPIHPDGTRDITTGAANTHVMAHAGRVFALVESSLPTELTCDLETVGPFDFGGRLRTPMTAHPKICAATGELHFFGYDFVEPWLTYHRADASGQLVQSEVIEVAGPTMMHDFAITENHVLFMDLPVVFDFERAMQGTMPYRWSEEYGARVGIMPRGGSGKQVRWFEVEPCYVFHPFNAFEKDGRIVVDVARYPWLWRDAPGTFEPARAHRWVIDPHAATVREQPLDDRPIEFPRVDERLTGRRHRYGYAVHSDSNLTNEQTALVKYDLDSGACEVHDFGAGHATAEGVFVAAGEDAGEDDGWVMTYVYDAARDTSDFVILDATNFAGAPQAVIELPQRVPMGFHGSWVAASR